MSSDEEEEIDTIFLNECVDDEINNNRSDDSQTDMNVEDDIDFSSAPAPKKKKQLKKTTTIQRGKGKPNKVALSSTQPVVSTNVIDNSNMMFKATKIKIYQMFYHVLTSEKTRFLS